MAAEGACALGGLLDGSQAPFVDEAFAWACEASGGTPLTCLGVAAGASRYLLSGAVDGRVSLVDLGAPEGESPGSRAADVRSRRGGGAHGRSVVGVDWYGTDGGCFASACVDGKALVWDAARLAPEVFSKSAKTPHTIEILTIR